MKISTHGGECARKITEMSAKKKTQMYRRFKTNPYLCPVYRRPLDLPESRSIGSICKKCGAYIPYDVERNLGI